MDTESNGLSFFTSDSKKDDQELTKPIEQAGLLNRLRLIIQTIGRKPNLEVTTTVDPQTFIQETLKGSDIGKMWFKNVLFDRKTGQVRREYVHIPKQIVEATENIAKGKAAHEAGHVAISRFGQFIPDVVMDELGFPSVNAATEERSTDQVVRDRYPGAGEWVDEARGVDASSDNPIANALKRLGYIPKFAQISDLITYHHFDEEKLAEKYHPDVIETYNKVKQAVEELERTIPSEDATEEEVIRKAIDRYKITYSRIWPEVAKLAQDDLENESLRQMVKKCNEETSTNEDEPGDGNNLNSQERNPLGQLPEELLNELEQLLDKIRKESSQSKEDMTAQETGDSSSNEPQADTESTEGESYEEQAGEMSDQTPGGDMDGGTSMNTSGESQNQEGDGQGEQPDEMSDQTPGEGGGELEGEFSSGGMPIPMDQMSPELKQKLQDIFNKLPQEVKDALIEEARKELENLEDDMTEDMNGKITDQKPKSHEQINNSSEPGKYSEQFDEGSTGKVMVSDSTEAGSTQKLEHRLQELKEQEEVYDRIYREVAPLIDKMYGRLEQIFKSSARPRWHTGYSTGGRIDMNTAMQFEADRSLYKKLWERKNKPERHEYAFELLVNISSQMTTEMSERSFRLIIILGEVLNRLGIKFEIISFSSALEEEREILKDFDSNPMSAKDRDRVSSIYLNNAGCPNPRQAIEFAGGRLQEHGAKENFMISIDEGCGAGAACSFLANTKRQINSVAKEIEGRVIGVAVGEDASHVEHNYPSTVKGVEMEQLCDDLTDMLEEMVVNPNKFIVEP